MWKDDYRAWRHNKSRDVTVKYGYMLAWNISRADLIREAEMRPSFNDLKVEVWTLQTVAKIKSFIWRVLSGIVLLGDVVSSKGLNMDIRCQICGLDGESANHSLFTFSLARQVRALSSYPCLVDDFNPEPVHQNLHTLFQNRKCKSIPEELRRCFPLIIWFLWKNRNNVLFEGKFYLASETMEKIMVESDCWFFAK